MNLEKYKETESKEEGLAKKLIAVIEELRDVQYGSGNEVKLEKIKEGYLNGEFFDDMEDVLEKHLLRKSKSASLMIETAIYTILKSHDFYWGARGSRGVKDQSPCAEKSFSKKSL